MIEMDYGRLTGQAFQTSIRKLIHLQARPKVASRTKKLVMALDIKLSAVQIEHRALIDKYAVKDEKGIPVMEGPNSPKIQPDKLEVFNKEAESFWETKFQVDQKKLRTDEFGQSTFSAQELIDLDPLMSEIGAA